MAQASAQAASGGTPYSGPSESDVLFGRACLSFGLVNNDQLIACVADQRRMAAEGRAFTLAQIMIGRKLISAEVYQRVVERIRQHLQTPQQAPQAPPDITASGRYADVGAILKQAAPPSTARFPSGIVREALEPKPPPRVQWGQAPPPSSEELAEATRSWEDASSVIKSPAYDVVVEAVQSTSSDGPVVVTPQAVKKERRDTGIRRILGVDEDATEFDFGPYRILSEVAAGGMGVIYRARAGDTGMIYALKALINVENANEKQLRRFIQEAQSAMRLDHPGIVHIHDIGIFENIPYFTMDLVEGKDLQHHLRDGTMPTEQLLEIVARICDAVHYAHEHAVIHRDLKPANIIIRDADRAPILTDFGLAKNLDSTFKLTAEGAMVGTPLFLSPEQVSGKGAEVDRRCDVYGMGVMLYQILTGRLPFMGRNPYEVYRKVLEEDPEPPTEVNPQVSPEMEKVCLMALAKQKEERYATAAEMAEDIRRYLRGEAVVAQPPAPAGGQGKGKGKGKGKSSVGKAGAGRRAASGGGQASPMLLLGIAGLVLLIVAGLVAIWFLL